MKSSQLESVIGRSGDPCKELICSYLEDKANSVLNTAYDCATVSNQDANEFSRLVVESKLVAECEAYITVLDLLFDYINMERELNSTFVPDSIPYNEEEARLDAILASIQRF